MRSAGNDIVALSGIDIARTNTQKFYSKILSAEETALYNEIVPAVIPFEKYVWLMWSIKEAAYKYLKRIEPGLVFTPVKFAVKQLDVPSAHFIFDLDTAKIVKSGFGGMPVVKSRVEVGSYTVYTSSIIYTDVIVSIADSDDKFDVVHWGVRKISFTGDAMQSEEVRQFLLSRASMITGRKELIINKNSNGIPLLFDGEEEIQIPVSLAHHGEYVGYSFKFKNSHYGFRQVYQ